MTHLNDSSIEIKVEPVSPPEVTNPQDMSLETCQGQGHAMVYNTPIVHHSPAWQSQQMSPTQNHGLATKGNLAKKALKNKIQSERRARGQEELVVNFEAEVKSELTDTEIKKRERRKEQNRRAARKCRIKKRQLQHMAQQQCSGLLQENQDLKDKNSELKAEVHKYRQLLAEHKNSGQCKIGDIPNFLTQSSSCPLTLNHQTSTPFCSPFSSSLPLSVAEPPRPNSEKACIEKIVRNLLMDTQNGNEPSPCSQYTHPESNPMLSSDVDDMDLINDIIEMDNHRDLSPFGHLDGTEATEDNGQSCTDNYILQILSNNITPKPRGVRNLTDEFARCELGSTAEISHVSVPFCNYQTTHGTTHLQMLQQSDQVNKGSSHCNSYLGNLTFPDSPQSCISSPPATSPSLLFQSPAELNSFSPGTTGCVGTPSSHIFQFPPYTRSSPSP